MWRNAATGAFEMAFARFILLDEIEEFNKKEIKDKIYSFKEKVFNTPKYKKDKKRVLRALILHHSNPHNQEGKGLLVLKRAKLELELMKEQF